MIGFDPWQDTNQAFGNSGYVQAQTLQPASRALLEGAENLLTKARRAMVDGDEEQARRLIGRASALPFDRHEETHPAAAVVQQLLFSDIVDELEASEPGERHWLDAALRVLAHAPDDWGRSVLLHVLADIKQDYRLDRSEDRDVAAALHRYQRRQELMDVVLAPAELADVVLEVLRTVLAYAEAADEART